MALEYCAECTTGYAVGLNACPHCGVTDTHTEEQAMAKISNAGVSHDHGEEPDGWPTGAVLRHGHHINPHDPLTAVEHAAPEDDAEGESEADDAAKNKESAAGPGDTSKKDVTRMGATEAEDPAPAKSRGSRS